MFMVIVHHSVTYVQLDASMYTQTLCKERTENNISSTLTELQGSPTDGQPSACSKRIGFGVRNRCLKRPPE